MSRYYILTNWIKSCLKGIELSGGRPSAILARAGVEASDLGQAYCSIETANRLFAASRETLAPSALGIDVRRGITPNSFHALGSAVLASLNLHEGLSLMVKYNAQLTNSVSYFLEGHGRDPHFGFKVVAEAGLDPSICDATLSTTVKTCRFVHPGEAGITRVTMSRARPYNACDYEAYFQAPVVWEAQNYAIHFSPEYLHGESMHADSALMHANERIWMDYISRIERTDIAQAVRQHLLDNLKFGTVELDVIAASMNMGMRSLQRRLERENISYKQLLDEVRQQEAGFQMVQTSLSVTEIAHRLGYSDSSNFCRAFKRWYRCSPEHYRRAEGHKILCQG